MAGLYTIRRKAKQFASLQQVHDLGALIHTEPYKLSLFAFAPKYHCFKMKKPKGGFREIEDPVLGLKRILTKVNGYLQACYYLDRPENVHGFTISASHDRERNIISNAKAHCGRPYLLNVDLKDFFHQVSQERVYGVFQNRATQADPDLLDLLTKLTCYRGRLPMGAPTSPVLSNYASLELDAKLSTFCHHRGFCYTRYADDLSFSSNDKIEGGDMAMIRSLIAEEKYLVNENKIQLFKAEDEKIVTGLLVKQEGVSLQKNYVDGIGKEVERFRAFHIVERRYMTGASLKKLKIFEKELLGKIQFGLMVEPESEQLHQWISIVEEVHDEVESFESVNWLEVPYINMV